MYEKVIQQYVSGLLTYREFLWRVWEISFLNEDAATYLSISRALDKLPVETL